MDREELNWLLQTIQDTETAKRFVLAQYKRGRISFQLMADMAGNGAESIAPRLNSQSRRPVYLTQYATTEFAIDVA
jgi:hypothetical protein